MSIHTDKLMTKINIKPATKNDAEQIADLSRETFYETFADHNTQADMDKFLTEQFSRVQLMQEVGLPGNTFLLAFDGNEMVGYIFLREGTHEALASKNAIEICRLYTRKSHIGKGIGATLMNTALDYAIKLKRNWVWLGVWEYNERAIGFYTAFGFEKFGKHDFLLGDDVQVDWLMKRRID